jgi:integrase
VAEIELEYTYLAKGKYWRFRRNGRDTKINGIPGSKEFFDHYNQLLEQEEAIAADRTPARSTLNWLIKKYEGSAEYRALADSTQTDYSKTLRTLEAELGEQPFLYITRKMVKAVRDDFADTARKAHKIKQMVSRLYSWADENDHVPEGTNPAAAIKRLKRQGGEREIAVWSDEEIDLFLKHCPERLKTPVLLALYTGQRKEDVLTMSWTQVQGDMIRVRQSKTGTMLDIPCHPVLKKHLAAERKRREGVQICIRNRATKDRPTELWNDNTFGAALYRAVRATPDMPPNRSLHGLRYASASRLEESGSTVAMIEAVLGHHTFKMALKYASQRLRAKAAMDRLRA